MFIGALFIMAPKWKQLSTGEWIYKVWSIHTMQYHLERKRNEVMTHATIWMSLENTMLSEGCQ